jgi:hypothetical protein
MKGELDKEHLEMLRSLSKKNLSRLIALVYWLKVCEFFTYDIPVNYLCWMWRMWP